MNRILVIADDLTGAAEIAGIGHRHGLSTTLAREAPVDASSDLTVIDTDSRLLSSEAASQRVESMLRGVSLDSFDFVYKKTDSVLRGNIVPELKTLLRLVGRQESLLIAQNPSRGRTIRKGHYYIDGVPLHQTSFANDADRPATTSYVIALLKPDNGVQVCDAETLEDVQSLARRLTSQQLPAGGADFFNACLQARGYAERKEHTPPSLLAPRLFLCGTASSARLNLIEDAQAHNAAMCPLSDELFAGNLARFSTWADFVARQLEASRTAVVYIPQEVSHAPSQQQRILELLSRLAFELRGRVRPGAVFIEGGATAAAVCRRLNWDNLKLAGELATGVVVLDPGDACVKQIVVKPGSYPWPQSVWELH